MNHTKKTWLLALERLKRCWRQIFATHLIFTALGIVLFTPLIGLTGRLLLKLSGQEALADQDIAWFLLSPTGLSAMIVFTGLLIGILAFEQAAMMRIMAGVILHQRVLSMDALWFTAARADSILLFTIRLVVRILIIVLPFLAIGAGIASLLITDYDINYYLTDRPPEFLFAAILIGLLLAVMAMVLIRKLLDWSVSLPLVLFNEVKPAASFSESAQITHNSRNQILGTMIVWAGAAIVLSIILLALLRLVGTWIIPHYGESISVLAMVLGGLSLLLMAGNFIITVFTSGSFASMIMVFYQQFGPGTIQNIIDKKQENGRSGQVRLTGFQVIALLVLFASLAIFTGVWFIKDIQVNDHVIIVAHRGAAGKAPENTMASFSQAIEDKTDWIEFDVQETADGKIAVVHDSDFMKLAGNPEKVWGAPLLKLQQIDIGSWFDPSFSNERVPALKDVLAMAKGRAKVVIELKYYGHDEQLEQRVIDIVEKMDMVNNAAIMSLKYDAVKKVRARRPDWTVGLLSATAIGDLTRLDTDFLAVATGLASSGFIRRAHEAGKRVFVWTINDPVSMSRMMSLGVDGIITDEPAMARQVMAERAKMSTAERLLLHTTLFFGQPFTPGKYRDESP
jgi:glycerophosphoryl diester phosphodiesterase